MRSKTILFFTLLCVAVIVLLVLVFSGVTGKPAGNTPFGRIDKTAIDRIVVASGNFNHVIIEKRVAGWLMLEPVEYQADGFQIQAALALFTGLEKERIVSNREVSWSLYKVGDDALQIRMYARGSLEGGLIIGKESPDGTGTFARIRGEQQVFLVNQPISSIFTASDTAWRLKNILEFHPSDVKSISYASGRQKYKLVSQEEKQKDGAVKYTWYLDGKLADQEAAADMADLLSRFTTNFFDDRGLEDKEYGLDKPAFTLRVEFKDAKAEKITIGGQESSSGHYYVRRGDAGQVFVVHGDTIKRINKSRQDLL